MGLCIQLDDMYMEYKIGNNRPFEMLGIWTNNGPFRCVCMHACLACLRACVYIYGMRVCEYVFAAKFSMNVLISIRSVTFSQNQQKEKNERKQPAIPCIHQYFQTNGILIGLYSLFYWLQYDLSYFHISTQKFSGEIPMTYVTTAHPLITIINDDNRRRSIQFKHQLEFQTKQRNRVSVHTCI